MKLQIGDLLWKYSCPYILQYKVVGYRIYQEGELYELEGLSCNHGEPCRLLIGGKLDELSFVEMLNNPDEDYWHKTKVSNEGYFRTSLEQARKDQQINIRRIIKENITTFEDRLKVEKEKLTLVEALIEELKG